MKTSLRTILIISAAILYEQPIAAYSATEIAWETKTAIPEYKDYPASASIDNNAFVIGGTYHLSMYSYNMTTNQWTQKSYIPGNGIDEGGAAVINGKIYAIGDPSDFTIKIYDPSSDTWREGATIPTPRQGMAVTAVNNKLYTIGGDSAPGLDICERYSPDTDTWEQLSTKMPTPRGYAASAVVDGKIYVIGGRDRSNPKDILDNVEVFDPATQAWQKKAPMPTRRSGAAAAVVNGKIIVFGGFGGSEPYLNVVEEYDPKTDIWTRISPDMPEGKAHMAIGTQGNSVFLLGGTTNSTLKATATTIETNTGTGLSLPDGTVGNAWVKWPGYGVAYDWYLPQPYAEIAAYANNLDMSGPYQCSELTTRFLQNVYNIPNVIQTNGSVFASKYANASGYINTPNGKQTITLKYYKQGSTTPPSNGTIISQTSPYSKNGHVSIVKKTNKLDSNTIEVFLFEQNWISTKDKNIAASRKLTFRRDQKSGGWYGQGKSSTNAAIDWIIPTP
jgi:N-acetylneuraminic acid mutarotase